MTDEATDAKKLAKLIHGIQMAMMTTVQPDGTLHTRPMATQQTDDINTLWFFSSRSSGKVMEIGQDHQVSLGYADPQKNRYVAINGTAVVVDDRAKAKELWNPFIKAWFPKGVDDPDLCLVKVVPQHAEYWDSASSTVLQLAGFLKATLTGKRATPGGHGEMEMSKGKA